MIFLQSLFGLLSITLSIAMGQQGKHILKPSRILMLLTIVNFLNILDFVILMPLGPILFKELGIGAQKFGWLVSSYTFAASAAGIASSFVADRFDRRSYLIFVFSGFILATLACGLAHTFWPFLLSRCLAGFCGGLLGSSLLTIISEIFIYEHRGRAMGILMSAASMSSVLGVPIGLWLATLYDWNAPFLILSALGFVLLILLVKNLPSMKSHMKKETSEKDVSESISFSQWKTVILLPPHLMALGLTVCLMLSLFVQLPYYSAFLSNNLELGPKNLPLVYLFGGFATFFTSRIIGRLSDKYGKFETFVFLALAAIPLLVGVTFLQKSAGLVAILCTTTLFMIFVNGRTVPGMTLISSSAKTEHRGLFLGVQSSVQNASAGIGSVIGGLIIGTNVDGTISSYKLTSIFGVVFSILALVFAFQIQKRNKNLK